MEIDKAFDFKLHALNQNVLRHTVAGLSDYQVVIVMPHQ